jgi:phage terminase large subunit
MKLLPKQEHCVHYLRQPDVTEILYGGAAGGGKSALGCLWLIEMCQTYPNTRWLMGRSKLKTLKETTLKTFFDLSNKLKLSNQYTFNAQSNVIKFHNGSEIVLKDLFLYPSDPDFDSLGSLELTGAFIDECNQLTYKAWQVVKSRIRYKLSENNLHPTLLGTCNPSKGWVYKQFYLPNKDGNLKEYRRFVQSLPTDNPHLPESYLSSLLQLDEASRERLYYGNWEYDDDKSALISYDAILDYFNPKHLKREGTKYITIDVARKGKDKTVARVWHGFLCIERIEIKKTILTLQADILSKLAESHSIPRSRIVADEDGVGGGLVDILGCKGFVNGSKALKKENFRNLADQCGFHMAKNIERRLVGEVNSNDQVVIDTSEEMQQVKIDNLDNEGKVGLKRKKYVKQDIGRSPDEWDSIKMRYYFELKTGKVFETTQTLSELGINY